MQAIVVRLSDLTFLSSEDLSGACSQAELGEKIIKQFAFLTGDIRVTITDGTARIEYRQPDTEKMSEAQRLSEQASQKAKSGDFPQALHLFTQALAANPGLPVTRRDLAMLHYELGDLSAAKDQLIDALRLAPDDAWSYVVLGNIFTREQDWDSAIRFFTKALDLKPGDAYALNGLGAASAKSGDESSAMRHFEAAIEANPHFPEPRFGKALLLKNQGHLDAAAEALESLLREASPGDARSNPVFQRESNFSPPSIRKSVNAAAPRIPNSSRKNTPLPCGISSMPSSASTPSILGVSWKSPSRSPVLAKAVSTTRTPRKNTPSQPTQANPSPASSSCASCMPDSNASLPSKIPAWI